MRVLVLGGSNSILSGGYVDGLRASRPSWEIDNRSAGASPGIQFLRFLSDDLTGYDAIVFDSAINDENFIETLGPLDYYRALMMRLFSSLAAQTRLVVIGFCNKRYFKTEDSPVFEIYRDLAHACGGEFRSVADFIRSHEWAGPLYHNDAHVSPPVAFAFGAELADWLEMPPAKIQHGATHADEFEVIDIMGPRFADMGTQTHKASSLHSFHSRLIGEGHTIEFDGVKRIIGCLIDAGETRCALRFSGADSVRHVALRFRCADTLRVKFVPFRGGVVCASVIVTALDVSDLEASRHEVLNYESTQAPQLSVQSFLAWEPRTQKEARGR